MSLVEDQTLRRARLTDEHPQIFQVHPISLVDDEISSLQCSLILLSLVGIEMVWDGTTPEADS